MKTALLKTALRPTIGRLGLLLTLAGLAACHPDADLRAPAPTGPTPWQPALPTNLPPTLPVPERNPLTREGVLLGRKLFYDVRLSGPNTVACATCHLPEKAFSDGVALASHGASGRPLPRHAPALQNLAWATGYFWDGGATDLESQAFGPIRNPDEMNQDLAALVTELGAVPEYPALFRAAFPALGLSTVTIARALAQFERTLITGNAPYDRWVRHEAGATLAADAVAGLAVVRQKCGACHAGDLFTDNAYHNNGLDTTYSAALERLAWGRARITDQAADLGKYKTPTLRNVALTAPYMHDGRFPTLDAVLDHYDHGVLPSATLDAAVQPGGTPGLRLSPDERRQIMAFLQTLTDTTFTHNPALRAE